MLALSMTYDVFDACFWKGTSKAQLFGFVFKGTLSVSGSRYDKVAEFSSYFDFDRWVEFEEFFGMYMCSGLSGYVEWSSFSVPTIRI